MTPLNDAIATLRRQVEETRGGFGSLCMLRLPAAEALLKALDEPQYVHTPSRDEIIEECAKVCEQQTARTVAIMSDKSGIERDHAVFNVATVCCAKAIRALISPTPQAKEE